MFKFKVGDLCKLVNEGFTSEPDGKNWQFIFLSKKKTYYEVAVIYSAFWECEDLVNVNYKYPLRLYYDKSGRVAFSNLNLTIKKMQKVWKTNGLEMELGLDYYEGLLVPIDYPDKPEEE